MTFALQVSGLGCKGLLLRNQIRAEKVRAVSISAGGFVAAERRDDKGPATVLRPFITKGCSPGINNRAVVLNVRPVPSVHTGGAFNQRHKALLCGGIATGIEVVDLDDADQPFDLR